ncbi:hypothetical protein [Pseudoduganella sp. R-34]|uniref:hypothetical protein n=1 Tax=Pseudoduganella sp. R-34 TaxID=3404062 RepID=UPI003CF083B1
MNIDTAQIADPHGVINSLQARIRQLEAQVDRERAHHIEDVTLIIGEVIKSLRAHGIILLHVGRQGMEVLNNELATRPILGDLVDQVWPLSQAPVSPSVKDALRAASNFGNDRWI